MNRRRKLIWQIYPSYVLITLVALIAVTGYASDSLRRFFLDQKAIDLEQRALLLEAHFLPHLSPLNAGEIDRICKAFPKTAHTRITVVLPNGIVIGDSHEDPAGMDNHGDREEVRHAIFRKVGTSIRYSATLEKKLMYVALPIFHNGDIRCILRTAFSVTDIDRQFRIIQFRIVLGGMLIALLAAGLSFLVSKKITRPLQVMKTGAERFAMGDLTTRVATPDTEEMAGLAEALNLMALQLNDRIETIVRQRNELETVLSGMQEGVIALDMDEHLLSMNASALNMLDCEFPSVQGKSVHEVVRNPKFLQFIERATAFSGAVKDDIPLYGRREQILDVHSSPLLDAGEKRIGTLVVLNDVTQIRQLENMRRDFVANVSHEIKTPLTAIKGFVETLLQGGVEKEAERQRFLDIIIRHVDRLNAIVTDLLRLSRIEKEEQNGEINLREHRLKDVIATAVQVCQVAADAREIDIQIQCPEALSVMVDPMLLEQAMVNLLDNAVKYSEPKSSVFIEVQENQTELAILFKDQGPGISSRHLPRLFERFYRVDKARSRKMGGTGLGLAITKHIVQAHHGRLEVNSRPGEGSVFTIFLPTRFFQ